MAEATEEAPKEPPQATPEGEAPPVVAAEGEAAVDERKAPVIFKKVVEEFPELLQCDEPHDVQGRLNKHNNNIILY